MGKVGGDLNPSMGSQPVVTDVIHDLPGATGRAGAGVEALLAHERTQNSKWASILRSIR